MQKLDFAYVTQEKNQNNRLLDSVLTTFHLRLTIPNFFSDPT